jgi:hypothetical protein
MSYIKTFSFLAVFACIGSRIACAELLLPVCSNRTINEVTQRVGCTVGDSKCWLSKGGFCTDYVQKKSNPGRSGKDIAWTPVQPGDVKKGDVAVFNSLPHYAFVESVVRDKQGKPVAVNVSEYNFGTCLVDGQVMVTDKYKKVNRRSGIPLNMADGGFIRNPRAL